MVDMPNRTEIAPARKDKPRRVRKALFASLILLVVLVSAWLIFFPMLGIVVAVGAGAWGVIVGTVIFLCVAALLFFIFSGIGIILLSLFSLVWVIFAITLFPFLFPIFIPLLIIVLFIAYSRAA